LAAPGLSPLVGGDGEGGKPANRTHKERSTATCLIAQPLQEAQGSDNPAAGRGAIG
jgi:hypothetical protein